MLLANGWFFIQALFVSVQPAFIKPVMSSLTWKVISDVMVLQIDVSGPGLTTVIQILFLMLIYFCNRSFIFCVR